MIFENIEEWRNFRSELNRKQGQTGLSIGFVPTMGALHSGHASLLNRARAENQIVVLSIYVNPTQFNNESDLTHYPRTIDEDLALAKECGVDHVLLPDFKQIYPDQYKYKVTESEFSKELCGEHRPGHFDGVLTVVLKLLNLVQPQRAYFGEKDFQQLELIRGLAQAFFLDVEIVACPTLREADGLAMSSRNRRLNIAERKAAPEFFEILKKSPTAELATKELERCGFKVDYVKDMNSRRYSAVLLGDVRLIDNVER